MNSSMRNVTIRKMTKDREFTDYRFQGAQQRKRVRRVRGRMYRAMKRSERFSSMREALRDV